MPSDVEMTQIEQDDPQWLEAVALKRERAFGMLEDEGLTRPEIEQRYAAYQQEQGIGFHELKLREEITGGYLLGWRQSGALMAYASLVEADLLGGKNRLVFNILDVCLSSEASPELKNEIVRSLRAKAEEAGAFSAQIYCNPALYEPVVAAGGIPVKQWFQWHLGPTRTQP